MNRKGFTLIELIVVIGLLGVVTIVIGVNMMGLQGKQKEKLYNAFKSKLESSTCVFFNLPDNVALKSGCRANGNSDLCKVKVGTLIDDGKIDEDLVDPRTNRVVDRNIIIKVKWVNYEQICELQE